MPPREILLTGATGFLGAFLLYELIERTDARIHCLVRARTIAEARGRLADNLRRYGLPVEGLATQILPLCGDLAKPFLGLSKQAFHELAKQLDAVCHNGAVIGDVQPYSALKPTNVSSTREVLRLACTGRIKAVHFVSTEDVFGDRYGFITEDDRPDPEAGLDDGYAQSKWVAEQLVRVAGQRGLPVALYRPTFITGHSITGMASGQDFINQLLKACIQLGKAPEEDYRFELAPVDYVSRCIVHFVNHPISLGRIFHLVSPESVSSRQIIGWLNDLGHAIEMVPYTDWRRAVQKAVGNDTTHPMFPLLAELAEVPAEPEPSASERRFTCPRTLEALQGSSIECPKIDISLFRIYLI